MDRRGVLGLGIGGMLAALGRAPVSAQEADRLFEAVRNGNAVAVMRHALAPGTGDPADFTIGDCSTQRNLSDEGRAQARVIGERFRANGIEEAEVRSSQWCRCLETAELLGLGPVRELTALNSFFRNRERGPGQTADVRDFIRGRGEDRPLVLVTHQVNVTAFTGVFPASGEIVVARLDGEGGTEVLGTIETDPA